MQDNIGAQVLDQVVLVQLDIRSSELAMRVERESDLAGANMPPANLVSAGVKHYADPKLKAVFNKLRKRAERECGDVGIGLLKGYAVPKEKAPALNKALKEMKEEYMQEANRLAAALPDEFRKWEEANPGWERLWRDRPTPAEIFARYHFRHVMYRMRPAGEEGSELGDAFGITSGSLLEAILDDVAKSAAEILDKSYNGKQVASGKSVPAIAAIGEKLKGFSMIDPLCGPVASMIGEVIAQVGATNASMSVTHTSAMRGLLEMLTKPERVRAHGAGVLRGNAVQEQIVLPAVPVITVVEGAATAASIVETYPDAEVVVVPPPPAKAPMTQAILL